MNKLSDKLNEEWRDVYSAGAEIATYRNKWVHFSQVPKLQVNPFKNHKDPFGIYFYPTNYINKDDLPVAQFAANYQYYYICEPSKTARILDLSKTDRDSVYDIALRNGWGTEFIEVEQRPRYYLSIMPKKLHTKPGAIFYGAADALVNGGINGRKMSWVDLFRGLDGLKDSMGIINDGEPKQMVIFSKKNVVKLAFGTNRSTYGGSFERIYKAGVKKIDPNCQSHYMYKTFTIDFDYEDAPVKLRKTNGGAVLTYMRNGLPFNKTLSHYAMNIDIERSNALNISNFSYHVNAVLKKEPPTLDPTVLSFDPHEVIQFVSKYYGGVLQSENTAGRVVMIWRNFNTARLTISHEIGTDHVVFDYHAFVSSAVYKFDRTYKLTTTSTIVDCFKRYMLDINNDIGMFKDLNNAKKMREYNGWKLPK